MSKPVITDCRITAMPKSFMDPMPMVVVSMSDGTVDKTLFSYYPDEISFTSEEFIGLTQDEAWQLKFKKDVKYLKS